MSVNSNLHLRYSYEDGRVLMSSSNPKSILRPRLLSLETPSTSSTSESEESEKLQPDTLDPKEVEEILNFVAQDGKNDPDIGSIQSSQSDQEVPISPTHELSQDQVLKRKARPSLTFSQKLKRLNHPDEFEEELKRKRSNKRCTKPKPKINRGYTASGYQRQVIPPPANGPLAPKQDLAFAMGISEEELSPRFIEERRMSIRLKLQQQDQDPAFSPCEEYDVQVRAEEYAQNMTPDPEFCYLHWEKNQQHNVGIPSGALAGKKTREHSRSTLRPPRRRRRRRMGDYYIIHPFGYTHSTDDDVNLPQGLCLVRPPKKLVELVALAISGSPDGLLQVQQVYTTLQNKFPYFRYMDKTSITSWRSSIRHALFQKWFRKVGFMSELINVRGCYWGINREHEPREWRIPSTSTDSHELDDEDIEFQRSCFNAALRATQETYGRKNLTVSLPDSTETDNFPVNQGSSPCTPMQSPPYETGEVSPVFVQSPKYQHAGSADLRSPSLSAAELRQSLRSETNDPDPMFSPREPFPLPKRPSEVFNAVSPYVSPAKIISSSDWYKEYQSSLHSQSTETGSETESAHSSSDPPDDLSDWQICWEKSLQERRDQMIATGSYVEAPAAPVTFSLSLPTPSDDGEPGKMQDTPVQWSPVQHMSSLWRIL